MATGKQGATLPAYGFVKTTTSTAMRYYSLIDEDGVIYLLTIFDKDEMTDLNHRECKALKTLVDAEKEARRARRAKGRAR